MTYNGGMRIWTQTVLPRLWLRNTSYLTRPEGRRKPAGVSSGRAKNP
jgi:hypothetical protein